MDEKTKKKVEAAFGQQKTGKVSDPDLLKQVNAAFEAKPEKKKSKELDAEERLEANSRGMNLKIGSYDTGLEMPPEVTQLLAGMGKRFTEIGTLGTHKADPRVEEELSKSGYATAGEVAADIASMAAGGAGLRAAGLVSKAPTLAQTVAGGALFEGATNEDRADAAMAGALGGAAGFGATKLLGKAINPNVSKTATKAIREGGTATPGEMFGGAVKAVEDKATSMPIVGDAISSSKRRSLEQYNKGVINDTLKPIGEKLELGTKAGADAIREAGEKISKEYDSILGSMNVTLDRKFVAEVAGLSQLTDALKPKQAKKFQKILQDEVIGPFSNPNAMLLGKTFKEVDSSVRTIYKDLYKKGDKQLGDAVRTLHASLLDMGKRQHPELGKRLDNADVAYAKLSRARDAAQSLGSEDRIFGPSQLLAAVKKSANKKQFAEGGAFGQKAIEEAKSLLPNKMPNSGTTDRLLMNMGALGAGVAIEPNTLLGLGAAAGAYSKPGLKALQALLTKGRGKETKAVREFIDSLAPATGLFGAALGPQSE